MQKDAFDFCEQAFDVDVTDEKRGDSGHSEIVRRAG